MQVDLVEPLGSETLIHGHLPDGTELVVKVNGRAPAGESVPVAIQPAFLHVFDGQTGMRIDPVG